MKNSRRPVVWYLSHYLGGPGVGRPFRGYTLAKKWQENDVDVYCIGASYHHLKDNPKITSSVTTEYINKVPYLWLKTCRYQGNGFKRFINMLQFAWQIYTKRQSIEAITGKPDIIIAACPHPFSFVAGAKCANIYQAKFILDIQDLWPQSLIEITKLHKYHPAIILLRWAEQFGYKHADEIVTVMANASSYLKPYHISEDHIHYIPNGIDVIEKAQKAPLHPLMCDTLIHLQSQGKFLIAYVGAQGVPNALKQLVQAMQHLKEHQHIHLVMVGQGSERSTLESMASNLQNITFFDPIEKNQVQSLLSEVDVCFLGWHDLPLYTYGVNANKIFDYMLSEKPIIHAVNTSYDPVQSSGAGIIVKPSNPQALADAILSVAAMTKPEREQLGANGLSFVKEHHDYGHLAQQYAKLFKA